MQLKKISIVLLSLITYSSYSQSFLNGNFEINTAGSCDYNNSNAGFTSKMSNAIAYGAAQELDIMDNVCPYGLPQSGTWFVGLAGNTDAFTMQLSAPLVAGQCYEISFWDQGNAQYPPAPPAVIGLSTVAGAVGTNIYTGPTPTLGAWSNRTFQFNAPNNGKYISVSVNAWRWLQVDNFVITSCCTPPILQMDSTNVDCFGACNGTATVHASGGGGPYTYLWNNGQTDSTATGLCAGVHIVTVTDAGGCVSSRIVTITEPSVLSSVNVQVNESCGALGTATVTPFGGTAPYSYLWNNGQTTPTATNLVAGNYSCTITDANNCTLVVNFVLTMAGGFTFTQSQVDVLCFGQCTGTATATPNGGVAPYTYVWAPAPGGGQGTVTATGLCSGNYSCTVTDVNGCTAVANFTINEPTALTATSTQVNQTCAVQGSATANPAGGVGPYTYLWSDGQTAQTANGLVAGNYSCTVTDANNCTVIINVTILPPANGLTVTSTQVDELCFGDATGTATANASLGIAPYSYLWSDGQTTQTAVGLIAGTYTCTVTDVMGCTGTVTVTITEPSLLTVIPQSNTTICIGQNTTLTAAGSGGTPPYSYTWTPLGPNVSPVITTVYTVTVTDANNCVSAPANVTVTVHPALTVIASNDDSICPGQTTTISAIAGGGNGGPYSYGWTWAPNGTSNFPSINVTPTSTTTYYVTAGDNCTNPQVIDSVTITVNPTPNIVFSADKVNGCKPLCVNFTDASTIATGSIVSWTWDFGDGTAASSQQKPSHCYSDAGSYNVTLTLVSNLGCNASVTQNAMITVYPDPIAEFTFTPNATTILNPKISFINQSVGASSFVWDFGDKNDSVNTTALHPEHTYADTGLYCIKLIATSADGCVNDVTHCLIVSPEYTFFIPSAFTPNGDGLNDVFLPKGLYILTFDMSIFNRWGEPIFTSNDLYKGWNGTANGGTLLCQQDVYVYKIKISYSNPDNPNSILEKEYVGSVTLVK